MLSLLLNKTIALYSLAFVYLFTFSVNALEVQLENGENLELYGIAIHQEKRNDIYLGSLFAPKDLKTIDGLFDPSISKRMSLKFISKYSNRKLTRLWKQRIAMNNAKENWRPLTKEIVAFSSLFKRAMIQGDEINIDFTADKGTAIYLNKTLFSTINNNQFFELLLNVWLGPTPPTTLFKTGITGNNTANLNEQLTQKFNQLNPQIGRFDADKKTFKAVTKTAKVVKVAKTTKQANIKKVKIKTNKKENNDFSGETKNIVKNILNSQIANSSAIKTTVEKVELDNSDLFKIDLGFPNRQNNTNENIAQTTREQNINTNINETSTLETIEEEKSQPLVNTNQQQQIIDNDALVDGLTNGIGDGIGNGIGSGLENSITNETEDNNINKQFQVAALDLPEEDFFDADLLIGSYTLELINNLRLKQYYPSKALRAGIEGDITVQIKINKLGEILSSKITGRSGSRVLDRGVSQMVRRAAPFPVIPNELDLNEFEFDVPLSFNLAK